MPYRYLRRWPGWSRSRPLSLRHPCREIGKPATPPAPHGRLHRCHIPASQSPVTGTASPSSCPRGSNAGRAPSNALPSRRGAPLVRLCGCFLNLFDCGRSLFVKSLALEGFQVCDDEVEGEINVADERLQFSSWRHAGGSRRALRKPWRYRRIFLAITHRIQPNLLAVILFPLSRFHDVMTRHGCCDSSML